MGPQFNRVPRVELQLMYDKLMEKKETWQPNPDLERALKKVQETFQLEKK